MISRGHRWIRKAVATLLGVAAVTQFVPLDSPSSGSDASVSAPGLFASLIGSPVHAAEVASSGQRSARTQLSVYRSISLIQACLLVSDELAKEHRWNEALVHLDRITEELNRLSQQHPNVLDMSKFGVRLASLMSSVKGQYRISYEQMALSTQTELIKILEKYKATLPTPTTKLAVHVANEILDLAATVYASSIEGKKFVDARKYQHSRGLVWSAELIYLDYSVPLEKADLRSLGDIRMLVNKIKAAFPTTSPPVTPLVDTANFRQHVARINQISTIYH